MLGPQHHKSSHSNTEIQACLEAAAWHTSSYSAPGGNCIQARGGQVVHVRDSKDLLVRGFVASPEAWNAFLKLATA